MSPAADGNRRRAVAAVIAPYALLLAAGGRFNPLALSEDVVTHPIKSSTTSPLAASRSWPRQRRLLGARPASRRLSSAAPVQFASASRYRVYNREAERVLPVGIAPERGLQVKTILVARSISALVPGDPEHRRRSPRCVEVASGRSGARRDDPQPHLGRGHSARKPDRGVRPRERATDSICRTASGAACTTRPAARKRAGTATMTTSTSRRTVADIPPAARSISAEPARPGRR